MYAITISEILPLIAIVLFGIFAMSVLLYILNKWFYNQDNQTKCELKYIKHSFVYGKRYMFTTSGLIQTGIYLCLITIVSMYIDFKWIIYLSMFLCCVCLFLDYHAAIKYCKHKLNH